MNRPPGSVVAGPPAARRRHEVLGALGWLAFVIGSVIVVHRFVDAPTAGAAVGGDPAALVMGAVRTGALVLGGYLAALTAVALALRALGWWRAAAIVEQLLPQTVRRALAVAVGLSLVTAGPAAAATPATSHAATVSAHAATPWGQAAGTADVTRASAQAMTRGAVAEGAGADDPITMRRLPDPDTAADAPPPSDRTDAPPPSTDPAPSGASAPASRADASPPRRTWTIEPGQHLWSIAESVLEERLGRPATDAEIDPYWRSLIEVNRPVLANPDLPDLVFPGQVLTVPDGTAGNV